MSIKTFKEMQFLTTFSSVRYTALNEMEIKSRKLVELRICKTDVFCFKLIPAFSMSQ